MKTTRARCSVWWAALAFFLLGGINAALAALQGQAGPYGVRLTTDPATIPNTGSAKLVLTVTNRTGKPVEGADVRAIHRLARHADGRARAARDPATG
jgi:hypothetical protein